MPAPPCSVSGPRRRRRRPCPRRRPARRPRHRPTRTSLPVPPRRTSRPADPQTTSLPAPASTTWPGTSTATTSRREVPRTTCGDREVTTIVAGSPRHRTTTFAGLCRCAGWCGRCAAAAGEAIAATISGHGQQGACDCTAHRVVLLGRVVWRSRRPGERWVQLAGAAPPARALARRSGGAGDDGLGVGAQGVAGRGRRAAARARRRPRGPTGRPRRGPARWRGAPRGGPPHRPGRRRRRGHRRGRPADPATRSSPVHATCRRSSSTGSVGTCSRRSVPGVLPLVAPSLARSMTSSASWKATPTRSPYADDDVEHLGRAPGEHRPEAGRGSDQRTGLVREDLDVVLDGVVVVGGPDGLVQLPEAQPLEGQQPAGARPRRRGRRRPSTRGRTAGRRSGSRRCCPRRRAPRARPGAAARSPSRRRGTASPGG